jgi:hypothetical protein
MRDAAAALRDGTTDVPPHLAGTLARWLDDCAAAARDKWESPGMAAGVSWEFAKLVLAPPLHARCRECGEVYGDPLHTERDLAEYVSITEGLCPPCDAAVCACAARAVYARPGQTPLAHSDALRPLPAPRERT